MSAIGISLCHVWKSYQTDVIKDLTLQLPDVGMTLFTGPSGCGKTTLAQMILGLVKPDWGSIEGTNGVRFSVVFQENRLLPGFTVADNINAPLRKHLTDPQLDELLDRLGLAGIGLQYPDQLSGGMQRRLAFARALAFDGDVFVLDEPFTGLDDDAAQLVIRQIAILCQNKPVILITHNPSQLSDIPHQVVSLG